VCMCAYTHVIRMGCGSRVIANRCTNVILIYSSAINFVVIFFYDNLRLYVKAKIAGIIHSGLRRYDHSLYIFKRNCRFHD